ncbi:MAG: hydrogenase maturation protease [Alphaproteobacteria bacterium]|nr:hydrogenase maturation protease [Alphaproteobacteria bacterium]MDE2492569.1 hydrogenase maturation protease [Alphaproteobacteria bacterium]
MSSRVIVLGVGNAERGDDGVGRVVAGLLRDVTSDRVNVLEKDGEATSLLAALEGAAVGYIVDACVSGAPAGTVHRIDVHENPLPQVSSDLSTHGFGLAAAIELGRALGQLPARTIVYAIEGKYFEAGAALSEPIAAAAAAVAERIRSEIAADLA